MMKKLSKIALLAAASAFMLAVFPACGDDEDDPSVEITGGDSVTIGETLELTAVVSDFPEFGVAYDWSSSDESVATVVADSEAPSKATVTPVAEGKATITVTASVGGTVAIAAIEVSVKAEGTDGGEQVDDPLKKSGTFTEDITALPFSVTTGLTDTVTDSSKNGKYTITNGTTIAGGYFKIVQSDKSSTVYYTDAKRSKINSIELDKQSNNSYIEFTVTGSAEITISAKSTGGSNTSYVEIVAADGTGTFETATVVTGNSSATEIKKTCKAGTYRIVVVTDDNKKSLARIESITAVQTVN